MKLSIFLICVSFVVGAAVGAWIDSKMRPNEITIVKKELVWQDKIVIRDYKTLTLPEAKQALSCYDTSEPTLDISKLTDNNYRMSASLCEREWERDITIEAASIGGYKFYIGIGIAAAAVGAAAMWKLR